MTNPRFPLHLSIEERKALRMAAAAADMTMTDFVRAAIKEKILREQAAGVSSPSDAAITAAAGSVKASDKLT